MNTATMPLVKVGARHQVTIPQQIARQIALKAGGYVAVSLIKNNIVITPKAIVDSDDAWFWSKEWQAKEHEADEAIRRGDVLGPFKTAKAALRALKTAKV